MKHKSDLRGADLRGEDFTNADLSGTDLSGTDLSDADLTGADLSGANLRDSKLSDALLKNADLTNAKLNNAHLMYAYLINAHLRNADLSDANLRNADLSDANLRSADLTNANLSNANLRGADLRGANLTGANLNGANLLGTIGINNRKLQQMETRHLSSLNATVKFDSNEYRATVAFTLGDEFSCLLGNKTIPTKILGHNLSNLPARKPCTLTSTVFGTSWKQVEDKIRPLIEDTTNTLNQSLLSLETPPEDYQVFVTSEVAGDGSAHFTYSHATIN